MSPPRGSRTASTDRPPLTPAAADGSPTEAHPERVELQRSAGGRYYWKLIVVGDVEDAVRRSIAADELLREHYGARFAPDPEPGS